MSKNAFRLINLIQVIFSGFKFTQEVTRGQDKEIPTHSEKSYIQIKKIVCLPSFSSFKIKIYLNYEEICLIFKNNEFESNKFYVEAICLI